MSDLTSILGGEWRPPEPAPRVPVEQQIRDAMLAQEIVPPESFFLDGKIHRFASRTTGKPGKGGDKPGWYVLYPNSFGVGGCFGDWRQGSSIDFHENIGRELTAAEQMNRVRVMAQAREVRDRERKKLQEQLADVVPQIWESGAKASAEHPYLKAKGLPEGFGTRVTGEGRLMVPMRTYAGELVSLQFIDPAKNPEGKWGKEYYNGPSVRGLSFIVGTLDGCRTLYIAEGFATAATIHVVTGQPCIVTFSAQMLPVVARQYAQLGKPMVIVADHDQSGIGEQYAVQASAETGARVVVPPEVGQDANDYWRAGGDLKALLEERKPSWLERASDLCKEPAPIRWIVKHWLQENALIMVHGPSGAGKTFVMLDWCLHIASSASEWVGNKVKPGSVVYLAGEGHYGMRSRIAAWVQEHPECGELDMVVSKSGCDLNTKEGYLLVKSSLKEAGIQPSIIVVDTLHRFLAGDENSAQDAKGMLDACAGLMRDFGCSVVLVHHTGVSEESQHRARGSSAWRGALDIEISITGGKDKPITIQQRKVKDGPEREPVHVELREVEIQGWKDEDGEPVTSAVIALCEPPPEQPKEAEWRKHFKRFERAWFASGAEEREGKPYVTRSALKDFLENDGISTSSVRNYLRPTNTSGRGAMIADLLNAGVLEAFEHGWVVCNENLANSMILLKNQ